jgi:hypothetical protein
MTKASPHKIARAVKYVAFAKKNPNDVDAVNFYLGDEKITQAQLNNFHAAVAQHGLPKATDLLDAKSEEPEEAWLAEKTPAPEPRAAGKASSPEPVDTAAPVAEDAGPQEAEEAEEQLTLSITEAKNRLLESQIFLRTATDQQRQCRARLSRAIAGWQAALGTIVTPEQNARAHIAHENEQRRLRAEGLLPARSGRARPGPSVIDAIAHGTAGAVYGNRSGAFAFKRGATDIATSQRRLNAMVAAAKAPSEQ